MRQRSKIFYRRMRNHIVFFYCPCLYSIQEKVFPKLISYFSPILTPTNCTCAGQFFNLYLARNDTILPHHTTFHFVNITQNNDVPVSGKFMLFDVHVGKLSYRFYKSIPRLILNVAHVKVRPIYKTFQVGNYFK